MTGAFEFSFTAIDGSPMPLAAYRGRAMLVVNVASRCGFTPQYAGLQKLHEAYAERGLTVIGVPSNEFMGQEPGDEAEIARFCSLTYGVTFPMTSKCEVKGGGAHPFYAWAAGALGESGRPGWNFHKILIGRDGQAASAYTSRVTPQDPVLTSAIEALL
jgi:glutathione peroxidase